MRRSRVLSALLAVCITALALVSVGTVGVAGAQNSKPKADDVGITATEIRLAVIADVDNSLAPGVFKASVDAMKAWAKVVNKEGGLAGRKVVIDFIDSKLNPNETRNATITACANDFAMVGGEALFMSNVDDMVACKNKAGEAIGLSNAPGFVDHFVLMVGHLARAQGDHRGGSTCRMHDRTNSATTVSTTER